MLDIKLVRQQPELVRQALKNRNYKFDLDDFLKIDVDLRSLIQQIESLRAEQNKINQEVPLLIKAKQDASAKIEESRQIRKKVDELNVKLAANQEEWDKRYQRLPNIPHESLPVGAPSANRVVKEVGNKPQFSFKPKDHIELASSLDIIDFERGAKLAGSNFVLYKGQGALLERALINFMLQVHTTEHGYKEMWPPVLVNPDSMFGTGQLPNLEEDMYKLKNDDLYLIPTAEVPLTNIYREEILDEEVLPHKITAYSSCFRREAGSYGKDTRGLVRLHQFDKVELVKFVKPEDSYNELELLLSDACDILDKLKLPYRILLLATGDISFASSKCYDIELYAPGMDRWLEVSSCSNFEDFQARRANIRYRDKKSQKTRFVHTLNGSGVALPRLVIALLENYQQEDGTISVPEALVPYLYGRKKIAK
nr:Seryl-tRNA synthetase [uncultured bacterium]